MGRMRQHASILLCALSLACGGAAPERAAAPTPTPALAPSPAPAAEPAAPAAEAAAEAARPLYYDRALTDADLSGRSLRELALMRNTIFARHGRAFKSDVLVSYFEAKPWYHVDPAYSEAMLSEIDKKNTTLVLSVEKDRGGPLTEFEHQMEEGWFVGA